MSELPILDTPNVHAYFDEGRGISFITYKGILDGAVTAQLYGWVKTLITLIPPDATRGVIFDFREVTQFAQGNLTTAQRQSREINQKEDQSNHPVALIVGNLYQEQMVKVSMKISPLEDRKRLVYTPEEALTYIETWHTQRPPVDDT